MPLQTSLCSVRGIALGAILAIVPAMAADSDISHILKGIENRYNHARTLRVSFSESYALPGRSRRTESGELFLRKPGKMRWQYTDPAGKLFISDGKFIYSYTPDTNRAEKSKVKETQDMRLPLAFLLGRLDFKKDFREFDAKPEGENTFITALPKSNDLQYRKVAFLVAPDYRIRRLIVTGQDHSVLEFTFTGETINPPVNDAMFKFVPPPGAEY